MGKSRAEPAYYAVARGRKTGIFNSWDDTVPNVSGYANSRYKKFKTLEEAKAFCKSEGCNSSPLNPSLTASSYSKSRPSRPSYSPYSYSQKPSYSSNKNGLSSENESSTKHTSLAKPYSPSRPSVPSPYHKKTGASNPEIVYTDGSSLGNGKFGAAAGCGVYFGPGDPRNLSERLIIGEQTNNRAELQAIIHALENTSGDVIIRADSKYAIQALTVWNKKWEKTNYMTSSSTPVKNVDLITRASRLMEDRNVELEYVEGHSTDYGNQQADLLARKAASL
ncbi:ribonuclease H Rnh1 [Schizosaccharomyces cryophilus OY26]|uniref:Ribonuclease H n=1 Tax=Schizosaccharomyces cryophilus (strain OY26 / ATCC MYA-4695 / CBS 11777 / NBRC 106824 / NRRL Y48691) TaxID=653667 RepID=S9W1M4_SCHCR|nr:ribonuclease H Rnh1 [Schizosaccharomyces cryophilus OY26]EPY53908.1 ribonuclease H Rnh1 [Schizosaccharomyces cryophilus OY26]